MSLIINLGRFLPYLTVKIRFDVHLTDEMTELDQTKHIFEIVSKNTIEQGVKCHDSLILGGFCHI